MDKDKEYHAFSRKQRHIDSRNGQIKLVDEFVMALRESYTVTNKTTQPKNRVLY